MKKKTAFPWRRIFPVSQVYVRYDPAGVKVAQVSFKKDVAYWNVYPNDMIDGDAIRGQCQTLDYAFELVDDTLEMHGWELLCTDETSDFHIRL